MARWCFYCCAANRQIHPLENVVDLHSVDIDEESDGPADVPQSVSDVGQTELLSTIGRGQNTARINDIY